MYALIGALVLAPSAGFGETLANHVPDFVTVPALRADQVAGAPDACPLPTAAVQIGKYEVTNIEYAAFLNAVARTGDPRALFSQLQEDHFWGGIVREAGGGGYTYKVKPGYGNLPVTFVSAHDAMRFANWLHYGRPSTGTSELGTTEGTSSSGAYDTRALSDASSGPARNAAARYFLPTCGEWMTAGFFDPRTRAFTEYSGGNDAPASGSADMSGHSANYYAGQWAIPFPHLARVNAYENNQSALGTRNQAGNVMEWVEGPLGHHQMALGGSLFLPRDTLSKGYRDSELSSKKLSSFGFRIARASGTQESLPFSAPVTVTAAVAGSSSSPSTGRGANVDWTLIDKPGNTSDLRTGYGCVAKRYEMARTEVTNVQYVAFLNAVAAGGDPYRLYLEDMATGAVGGIVRRVDGERASYQVKPGYEDRPAAYLSWFALARMANWYHFGQPNGMQVAGVTEGDYTLGAYDTRGFASFEQAGRKHTVAATLFERNPDAKYFLPSNDEWYKAAYYDPERPGLRKYWSYPNRNDTPPGSAPDSNGANYQVKSLGEGGPYYVSTAGRFASRGYYDLLDMGGNLWEWLETWRGLGGQQGWRRDIPTKGLRGGSFNYIDIGLSFNNIDPGYPSDHYFVYGGRLARAAQSESTDVGWCLPPAARERLAGTLQFARKPRIAAALAILLVAVTICIVFWGRRRSKLPR
ncbi:SUMF1/EgtB/PvdO family nonheme iron enzyme [Pseudorhodoferax sp. Leaf274]|uniref:SUMF1/EgtB/PvdO family nonheme iron enzyme n=1 Tax=Pseudorhodoferax sp. Leaf274 TaxID=1736318 RepID=UPI00138F09ED|nr:SUMF1/EgtB/PvdO family nonheme iron enzyme [Pseudorhodoferax sp. Leaf274]